MHDTYSFLISSIPVLAFVGMLMWYRLRKTREARLLLEAKTSAEQTELNARTMAVLEERLRTLECIAVDRATSVAQEIDRLHAA